MTTILRKETLDFVLTSEHLGRFIDLWSGWHSIANGRYAPKGVIITETLLTGFARAEASRLLERLRAEATTANLALKELHLPDADTIKITRVLTESARSGLKPPWITFLNHAGCENLCVALRIRFADNAPSLAGQKNHRTGIAIYGVLKDGHLLTKALWPFGNGMPEELFHFTRWENEPELLRAVEDYIHFSASLRQQSSDTRTICFQCQSQQEAIHARSLIDRFAPMGTATLADGGQGHSLLQTTASAETVAMVVIWLRAAQGLQQVFSEAGERLGRWLVWPLFEMPGEMPLRGFILRIAFWTALAAVALLALNMVSEESPLRYYLLSLFWIACGGCAFACGWKLHFVRKVVHQMRQGLARIYSGPCGLHPLDAAKIIQLGDQSCWKLSTDLLALGGTHHGDFRTNLVDGFTRVFYLQQNQICFSLSFLKNAGNLINFPHQPLFLVETRFADGTRLVSFNTGGGYRKKLDPNVTARLFERAVHPAEILESHGAVLHRLTASGKQVVPQVPDAYLADQTRMHEDAKKLMVDYGFYRWSDGIRESFRIPRPEFLEQ